jgi:urease accessory protein UreH
VLKNRDGTKSKNSESLEARLRAHPILRTQVERLLDEVENRGGALNTADEAEDALVVRLRAMGQEALREWAQQREAQVQPGWAPQLRRGGKKNSNG